MNSRRGGFRSIELLGIAVCIGISTGVPVAIAQDWLRASDHWSSRSLMLRGQEPELGDTRGVEHSFGNHIETDRDSFTPSTRTVEVGRRIVESSYSFIDNRDVPETHSLPELLLRYGLSDWIELRLGGNYEVGGEGADVSGGAGAEHLEGSGLVREIQLLYGLKLRLSEQYDWSPESSLIVQGHTPMSGPDPATAFSLGYVFGWELPDDWKIDSAIRYGADNEGNDQFETWSPSIVLRKTITRRWNVHAEYFGHFSQDRTDDFAKHFVSPGVHYLISPDLELGVRVGWGLNDEAARFFSNAGIGWRF
ncbi:MAG: transporter [Planctomycetales bacterium]|nr:transporter [Planctomycetales bacterium]